MKIVKLKAGLGNQMFQYAFAKLLQNVYGIKDVLIDTSYFSQKNYNKYLDKGINLFNISYLVAQKKDLRHFHVIYNGFRPHHFLHRIVAGTQSVFNKNYYFEKNRAFIEIDSILKYSYFDGYWQSWRYLEPIRNILLNDFTSKKELSDLTKSYMAKYKAINSVFVGIRKGDYTESSKSIKHYGCPSREYYMAAIDYFNKAIENPFFVVFSDDIEWVKRDFDFAQMGIGKENIEFRDKGCVYSDFEELFVMSSCHHAIISNSTFNFWGAWLIPDKNKKVIAPKEWFKDGSPIDIIPPYWIQL